MKKLPKWCWVATETAKGWRLKLALGNKDFNVVGALLPSIKDVTEVITGGHGGKVVFVHMRDSKEPVK